MMKRQFKGYIQNLQNGTVEVVAEIFDDEFDIFMSILKEGSLMSEVGQTGAIRLIEDTHSICETAPLVAILPSPTIGFTDNYYQLSASRSSTGWIVERYNLFGVRSEMKSDGSTEATIGRPALLVAWASLEWRWPGITPKRTNSSSSRIRACSTICPATVVKVSSTNR